MNRWSFADMTNYAPSGQVAPPYRGDRCNIVHCEEPILELLLCRHHLNQYITDEDAYRTQARVTEYAMGRESHRNYLGRLVRFLFHLLFLRRIRHVEHYALESLFLVHFRNRQWQERLQRVCRKQGEQLSDEEGRERAWLTAFLGGLAKDFGHPANVYLPQLRLLLSVLRDQAPSPDEQDYRLEHLARPFFVFNSQRFLAVFSVAMCLQILARLVALTTTLELVPLFNMRLAHVVGLLIAGYGWAYAGRRYSEAIHPVVRAALGGRLYDDPAHNLAFLRNAYQRRARLVEGQAYLVTVAGCLVPSLIVTLLGTRIWAFHLSWLERALSITLNLPAVAVAFALVMTYPVVVRLSPLVWNMPKAGFRISLYDLDESMGLAPANALFASYLLWNVASIAVAFILLLVVDVGSSGFVLLAAFVAMFAVLRAISLVHVVRSVRWLRQSVGSRIHTELGDLGFTGSFADTKARHDLLGGLQYRLFAPKRASALLVFLSTAVVIPVALTLADKYWSQIRALVLAILALLARLPD